MSEFCKREGPALRGKRVLFRGDNQDSVTTCNRRFHSAGNPLMNDLCNRIDIEERTHDFLLLAKWTEGIRNGIADAGSRRPGFDATWAKDPLHTARFSPKLLAAIARKADIAFIMDCFADNAGVNAQFETFCSPSRSAFIHVPPGGTSWAFPPPAIALDWCRHCIDHNLDCVVLLHMHPKMIKVSDTKYLCRWWKRIHVCPSTARIFTKFCQTEKRWKCFHQKYECWVVRPLAFCNQSKPCSSSKPKNRSTKKAAKR